MSSLTECTDVRALVRKASSLDDVRMSNPAAKNNTLRNGSSLLHVAAYFGRANVVRELLQKTDLDPAEKNALKWSSQHYLCRFHQPLNNKLSLGLKPKSAKKQSSAFKFSYIPPRPNANTTTPASSSSTPAN